MTNEMWQNTNAETLFCISDFVRPYGLILLPIRNIKTLCGCRIINRRNQNFWIKLLQLQKSEFESSCFNMHTHFPSSLSMSSGQNGLETFFRWPIPYNFDFEMDPLSFSSLFLHLRSMEKWEMSKNYFSSQAPMRKRVWNSTIVFNPVVKIVEVGKRTDQTLIFVVLIEVMVLIDWLMKPYQWFLGSRQDKTSGASRSI